MKCVLQNCMDTRFSKDFFEVLSQLDALGLPAGSGYTLKQVANLSLLDQTKTEQFLYGPFPPSVDRN